MKIRRKVFETNSSSSHSVVIDSGPDFVVFTNLPDVIHIGPGEYGWGYDELNSWIDKASYAYTYAANYGRFADLDLLKKVIEDYTNVPVVFDIEDDEWYPKGYIDHQSIGEAESIFESYDTIKQCIFGKHSSITIDNDNH